MKLQEVTYRNYKSQELLTESWEQLTEAQKIYLGKWETSVWPLVEQYKKLLEADLQPNDIMKIFQNAEKIAMSGGNNRTALGKAGDKISDVTGKIKTELEKLAKQAKNSQSVKDIDKEFNKLRSEIATKVADNENGKKLLTQLDKWKEYSKENPTKSTFILGAMTLVLSFAAGGVLSGLAIGMFIKTANNILQGDELSTAIGKTGKMAALGAVGGILGDLIDIGGDSVEQVNINASPDGDAAETLASTYASNDEFADAFAKKVYDQRLESINMEPNEETLQKIRDNVEITGDITKGEVEVSVNGTFVGGHFLTTEEAADWQKFVDNKHGGDAFSAMTSDEGRSWLQDKSPIEGKK